MSTITELATIPACAEQLGAFLTRLEALERGQRAQAASQAASQALLEALHRGQRAQACSQARIENALAEVAEMLVNMSSAPPADDGARAQLLELIHRRCREIPFTAKWIADELEMPGEEDLRSEEDLQSAVERVIGPGGGDVARRLGVALPHFVGARGGWRLERVERSRYGWKYCVRRM